jgi:hypothetical protein
MEASSLTRWVAAMLDKLLIEQTKSRPRRSNDNGLVEAKNGAVIRKHIGYGHIAAGHAGPMEDFYEETFNRYLNFHRPCGQPEIVTSAKGKQKRFTGAMRPHGRCCKNYRKCKHISSPVRAWKRCGRLPQR